MKRFLFVLFLTIFFLSCVSVVIQQTGRDNDKVQQEEENKETVIGEDNAQ